MRGHWTNLGLSTGLSALALLAVALVLGLLASTIFFPQQFLIAGVLLVTLFLGLQLLVFRLLGLKSKADQPKDAQERPEDRDWRAWRG